MVYDPEYQHRGSHRLKGYDYSSPAAYYITICTKHRTPFFEINVKGEILRNDSGRMLEKWFHELEIKFPNIHCDLFICMPDHIHFIIILEKPCPSYSSESRKIDIPTIVQWYKTMTTNEYIRGVKNNGWTPFNGKLWQRNYFDYIVRDSKQLEKIRQYIVNNPSAESIRNMLD